MRLTAAVNSGADIKTVQTLARHKKPVTTPTHYAKASPRNLLGAIRSLPNRSGRPAVVAEGGAAGPSSEPISEDFAAHDPGLVPSSTPSRILK
jgi:hypothetical protein